MERISPCSAVILSATGKSFIVQEIKRVVARPSAQVIGAAETSENVVAVSTVEKVIAERSGRIVISSFAMEPHRLVGATGQQHIVSAPAPSLIVPAAAMDRVVAVLSVELVIISTSVNHIVSRPAIRGSLSVYVQFIGNIRAIHRP